MVTTTACAAKWTATKLLVYTNVSNHASDAIGAIDSGKVSSYLFAGAELDRLDERGEVPINPQLVPNLPLQVSIIGEASVYAASLDRIPGCAPRSAEKFLVFHRLAQGNVGLICRFPRSPGQRVRGRRSFVSGGRHSTGRMKVVA